MTTTPPAIACATSLIDALVDSGVRDFVLSPGSRSAPLALALADREVRGLLRLHVRLDERSAGFFALGIARGSDGPVAVVCTSGSAVANLHPAVIEANYSGVPLLLLTADRPEELRGVGASQTIDQAEIFGTSVRWFEDVSAPETGDPDEVDQWSNLAVAAAERARSELGPVHLNLAFRPPLVGGIPAPSAKSDLAVASIGIAADPAREPGPQQDVESERAREGASDRWRAAGLDQDVDPNGGQELRRDTERASQDQESWQQKSRSGGLVQSGEAGIRSSQVGNGLLVVGDLPVPARGLTDLSSEILRLAEELCWPVVAEPTANLAQHPNVLAHGTLIAGSAEFTGNHRPDLVVSVGRFGLSRAVASLVSGARQHWALAADCRGEPADPDRSADLILTALPTWTRAGSAEPDRATDQLPDPLHPELLRGSLDDRPKASGRLSQPPNVVSGASGTGWLTDWIAADKAVDLVIQQEILGPTGSWRKPGVRSGGFSGAGAALAVWDSLSPNEAAFLAASWPIRFIDSFAGETDAARVLANRGANGIDGLVSTALGVAAGVGSMDQASEPGAAGGNHSESRDSDDPRAGVVAILGDVAFLHDLGGLVGAGQLSVTAVLVVLNNDGGGIFSQLEQAAPTYERDFERVFGTPHGQDLAGIARSMDVSACDVRSLPGLRDALARARATGGVRVIVAHTADRRQEAALLRHLATESAAAISGIGK